MKFKTLLPLLLTGLLCISIILKLSLGNPYSSIFFMLVYVSLQLSLYASFYKNLKQEEQYLNNTKGQNIIIGLSGIVLVTIVISLLFKIMHWPFAGPLYILTMLVSVICALYIAFDAFANYRKTKTTYGAQYLLLILPSIIFIQSRMPTRNYSEDIVLANIQRMDNSKMLDVSDLEKKIESFTIISRPTLL